MQLRNALVFFALTASLMHNTAQAIQWRFVGPGRQELMNGNADIDLRLDLLSFTSGLLRSNHRPLTAKRMHGMIYIDSMFGVASQMVTVAPGVVRSFGWCFTINGQQPQSAAASTYFSSNRDQLVWFFGYLENRNGDWSSACVAP